MTQSLLSILRRCVPMGSRRHGRMRTTRFLPDDKCQLCDSCVCQLTYLGSTGPVNSVSMPVRRAVVTRGSYRRWGEAFSKL